MTPERQAQFRAFLNAVNTLAGHELLTQYSDMIKWQVALSPAERDEIAVWLVSEYGSTRPLDSALAKLAGLIEMAKINAYYQARVAPNVKSEKDDE